MHCFSGRWANFCDIDGCVCVCVLAAQITIDVDRYCTPHSTYVYNYYQFRSRSKYPFQQIISDIYWTNFEFILFWGTSCNCCSLTRSLARISAFIVATILMVVVRYKYKYAKLVTIKTHFDKFHYKIHAQSVSRYNICMRMWFDCVQCVTMQLNACTLYNIESDGT